MTTTCSTCQHAAESSDVPDEFRQCRRHAPVLPPLIAERNGLEWLAVWPTVHGSNWCGDWAPSAIAAPGPDMPPDDVADMSAEQLRDFFRAIGVDPTQPADANPITGTPQPFSYDDAP